MKSAEFLKLLENHQSDLYPVLGTGFSKADFCPMPLSVHDTAWQGFDVTAYEGLDAYARHIRAQAGKAVAYGGYGEHRPIYGGSAHFKDTAQNRCIHLGIDLWTEAQTPVFAPLDGYIHSFRYNDQYLDYGATLITAHEVAGQPFYLLFGHLSLASLALCAPQKRIQKGEIVAWLGDRAENGGWSPHLHLQMIRDLGTWSGDYPGVATQAEAPQYLDNCPSPALFCGLWGLKRGIKAKNTA